MKHIDFHPNPLLLSLASLLVLPFLQAGDPPAVSSELFATIRLVYEDGFESGTIDPDFWEVRQSSTWKIVDGVLTGSQSSKEFQEKKIAAGDKAHAGFKPVMWLRQVPESFVCSMRVRYDGDDFIPRFPLIDLGHHIHTLTFSREATTLTIRKDVEKIAIEEPLFTLNQWHDVVIELKKGTILLSIDGKQHTFQSPNIDMTGHSQIDFKGINFGTCEIDHIRVWEGTTP